MRADRASKGCLSHARAVGQVGSTRPRNHLSVHATTGALPFSLSRAMLTQKRAPVCLNRSRRLLTCLWAVRSAQWRWRRWSIYRSLTSCSMERTCMWTLMRSTSIGYVKSNESGSSSMRIATQRLSVSRMRSSVTRRRSKGWQGITCLSWMLICMIRECFSRQISGRGKLRSVYRRFHKWRWYSNLRKRSESS